jgi:hypothetical protein
MTNNSTLIGCPAAFIWGLTLGSTAMNALIVQANDTTGGVAALANREFNAALGTSVTGACMDALAKNFIENLGLTSERRACVIAQLAIVPVEQRGAKLLKSQICLRV